MSLSGYCSSSCFDAAGINKRSCPTVCVKEMHLFSCRCQCIEKFAKYLMCNILKPPCHCVLSTPLQRFCTPCHSVLGTLPQCLCPPCYSVIVHLATVPLSALLHFQIGSTILNLFCTSINKSHTNKCVELK